ncbi:hypothetical protein ACFYUY_29930 [Kitasatospora sp. NPDC004745]|uniref:hypothetical protein n=1 Tax=unclassified Kitasatospora TaxID=2633591 RepID=UPI0033D9FB43
MTTGRYAIIPADDACDGSSYPVWIVRDRTTGEPVRALPPSDAPLRFYSYALAQAWVLRNAPAPEPA